MSRAVGIEHAFGVGFTWAKALKQPLGCDDRRGRGVTWASGAVLCMRNGAALLCVLRLRRREGVGYRQQAGYGVLLQNAGAVTPS